MESSSDTFSFQCVLLNFCWDVRHYSEVGDAITLRRMLCVFCFFFLLWGWDFLLNCIELFSKIYFIVHFLDALKNISFLKGFLFMVIEKMYLFLKNQYSFVTFVLFTISCDFISNFLCEFFEFKK